MIATMDGCESALERRCQLFRVRLHQRSVLVLIVRWPPIGENNSNLESVVRVPEGNRAS